MKAETRPSLHFRVQFLLLWTVGQKVVWGTQETSRGGCWRERRIKGRSKEKVEGDRELDKSE